MLGHPKKLDQHSISPLLSLPRVTWTGQVNMLEPVTDTM